MQPKHTQDDLIKFNVIKKAIKQICTPNEISIAPRRIGRFIKISSWKDPIDHNILREHLMKTNLVSDVYLAQREGGELNTIIRLK